MALKQLLQKMKDNMPSRGNPEEDEIKRRADESAAAYESRVQEPIPDEPGLEHDEVSGAVMDLPATMLAGPARAGIAAGEGMVARMSSKSPTTSEINKALRAASPRTQSMAINDQSIMDRIRREGTKVIDEMEEKLKSGTRAVGRAMMGAKSSDQGQSGSRLQVQKKFQQ